MPWSRGRDRLNAATAHATEHLLLIHHDDSVFSKRIRDSINEIQGQLERGA